MVEVSKMLSPYNKIEECLVISNTTDEEKAYSFGDIIQVENSYTFSCWFKCSIESTVSIQISDKSGSFKVKNEWRKAVLTADTNISVSKEVLFTIPANCSMYVFEGMLETGNTPSDFKVNPDDVEDALTTLQTDFKVEQGKIRSLIKETTIENEDGSTSSLKDKYLETVSTVDGMNTTIGDIKTSQNEMNSKITTIETTAEGIKTSVTKAQTDAELAKSTAQQAADKFSWLVESGTDKTNFTLTSRTAELIASDINLHGRVTFEGLDSNTQTKINKGIGGRNYARKTSDKWSDWFTPSNNDVNSSFDCATINFPIDLQEGDEYTISMNLEWKKFIKGSNGNLSVIALMKSYDGDDEESSVVIKDSMVDGINGSVNDGLLTINDDVSIEDGVLVFDNVQESRASSNNATINVVDLTNKVILDDNQERIVAHIKITQEQIKFLEYKLMIVASYSNGKGSIRIKSIMVEKGSRDSDWQPAPEDKASQSIIDGWTKDTILEGTTTINGGVIKTGTIDVNQLNVKNIFADGEAVMNIINSQEINANRITTGQLSAERLDVYGLNVLNKLTNQQTFNIDTNGEVTIRGSVSSYNYLPSLAGWTINNDGTAEFNDVIARGSVITNDGGIVSSGGAGKNLLLNSSLENNLDNWNGTNYTIVTEDGYNCAKVSGEIGISKNLTQNVTSKIKKDTTTHYTVSAWVKLVDAKKGSTNPFCALYFGGSYDNNGTNTFLGTTAIDGTANIFLENNKGWQYVTYTFKFAQIPKYMNFYIYARDFTGNLFVRDIKLEEGDISTPWSASPEDNVKQVRIWAGKSYEEREDAPFIVYNDGSVKATRGEYSGLWTGNIEIGNITIADPKSNAGNDALITIQNGSDGVKRVQLTDTTNSSFAQDVLITNNTYSTMVSLKQDGTGVFTRGITVGGNIALNTSSLLMGNKELTTGTNGFVMKSSLDIGTSSYGAKLNVYGDINSNNSNVDDALTFGSVVKFSRVPNGLNIDFIE